MRFAFNCEMQLETLLSFAFAVDKWLPPAPPPRLRFKLPRREQIERATKLNVARLRCSKPHSMRILKKVGKEAPDRFLLSLSFVDV